MKIVNEVLQKDMLSKCPVSPCMQPVLPILTLHVSVYSVDMLYMVYGGDMNMRSMYVTCHTIYSQCGHSMTA